MTARRFARRVIDALAGARYSPFRPVVALIRPILVARRLRGLLRELEAASTPGGIDIALLTRIYDAWGNPGWTADPGFLRDAATGVLHSRGPVLDCGSGLSTIICATIARRHGDIVISLEQDAPWHRYMRRILRALEIRNVELWHAPLRSYGEFAWFDIEGRALPDTFGFVVCDGPSVGRRMWSPEIHANWRVGVVLVLKDRRIAFSEVVLDDLENERSDRLIDRWQREGLDTRIVETTTGRHLHARYRRASN